MKKKGKRLLSFICCLVLLMSMSITSYAAIPDVSSATPTKVWELSGTAGTITAKYYEDVNAIIIQAKDDAAIYQVDGGLLNTMNEDLRTDSITNLTVYAYSNIQLPERAFGGTGNYGATYLKGFEFIKLGSHTVTIPDSCFESVAALTSIDGLECVTSIGDKAFKDCNNLTWTDGVIDLSNASISAIGDQAFNSAGNVTTLKLPTCNVALGRGSFMNNFNLNHIYNMSSVTSIGESSFAFIGNHTILVERDPVNDELADCVLNYDWEDDNVTIQYSKYKYTWNLVKANTTDIVYSYPSHDTVPAYPNVDVETNNRGVYSDVNMSSVFDMTAKAVSDKTLYVKMTDMYSVTFDTKGGSLVPSCQLLPGSKITKPANPTKTDHTFNGWYKDSAYTTLWDFDNDTVNANVTLHAKWTYMGTTLYTVAFNTNGGSTIDNITVAPNSTLTKPVDPTKEGHTFAGWYKESACTNAWNFATDVVTADTTLYAKWTANAGTTNYTVTWETNGATAIAPITVASGSTITAPVTPTKSGYTFVGWYKDSAFTDDWDFATDTVTSNITLYAKWTVSGGSDETKYTVTLKLNGGTSKVETITVVAGNLLPKPDDPTKKGHTFAGWYKDAALSTPWNFDTDTVNADITIYADWTANEYTVKFKLNGGEGDIDTQYVLHGEYAEEPDEPERDDYTFDGWYTSADFATKWNFESNKVTKNLTLYAKWLSNEVTVVFDSQGGSDIESQVITRGSFAKAPAAPTKENYIFGGWYKEAECKNAFSFSTKVTDDIVLYAKWTTTQVTVTFNTQGGAAVAPVQVAPGSTIAVPVAPTRQGYTFLGWYKDAECKTAWNFTTDVVNENITLYAKWIAGNVALPQTSDATPLASAWTLLLGSGAVLVSVFKRRLQ